MSLQSIIDDTCDQVGIPRIPSAMSSSDQAIRRMVRLSNAEGRALASRYPWQALSTVLTTETTADEATLIALADIDDFGWITNDTAWNNSQLEQLAGPVGPQDWRLLQSSSVTGPYYDFRIVGGSVELVPAPVGGETITFEYQSKWWIANASSPTTKARDAWANDDDVSVLDEELLTLGLVWRFLRATGMDYSEEFREYEGRLAKAAARDGGKRVKYMDEDAADFRPSIRAPVGSWNLP